MGVYTYEGACVDQYTGKTTVQYSQRSVEHIRRQKTSSVDEAYLAFNVEMTLIISKFHLSRTTGVEENTPFQRGNISGTLELRG